MNLWIRFLSKADRFAARRKKKKNQINILNLAFFCQKSISLDATILQRSGLASFSAAVYFLLIQRIDLPPQFIVKI